MTTLGRLEGEEPQPLTDADLEKIELRIRASWNGIVTIDKRELEQLLRQIQWQAKRLRRVEHVLQPLADEVMKLR